MNSRASAVRMKWKKKEEKRVQRNLFPTCQDDSARAVGAHPWMITWTWSEPRGAWRKNHRYTWSPRVPPLRPFFLPSFLLSFASSSSIISLFRIVRAGRKRWWWCVRACTRFATPPTHLPWSQCHGEPTRADTWPRVAERELGNLVYPGRE